jgi:hypothetical protein
LTFEYTALGDPPTTVSSLLTATITQVVPGVVAIRLEPNLPNLQSYFGEGVNPPTGASLAFNLDPSITGLTNGSNPACVNTTGNGCSISAFSDFGVDSNQVGLPGSAFQGFDLALFLAPPPDGQLFQNGDIITWTFRATNLIPDSFNFRNSPSGTEAGAGQYCSAARVGLSDNGQVTSKVVGALCPDAPTPSSSVPGPLPVIGASVAFGFSRRLRRRIGTYTTLPSTGTIG